MIRPATTADAAALAALWNPMIRDTAVTFNALEKTGPDIATMIGTRQADGHAFLVATDGSALLGFATYAQFRGGVGYARTMEHTIILAPEAQGRGTGRALMTALETHARDGGAHSMFAGVSAENPAGRAFHARIGYAEVAVLRQVGHKFGRYMDLVLMQKFLT
ncbi:GNAT family N-acetyltransferase [Paragemmobacter straminiformis]|uniref:N-acetyltransferase n=1 Tax=Paragemmobacter straminiformis TaxID=2045119 RepID=A0A842IBV6_9RHOB|nr:GNAT family N-acetyltransferase [Gemmobacter straminiformis]MBC2837101.1 N-acetyltransferase [Gemmobacter straminiformis]